ncbi:MAG: diguanylate cyclase [Nitrospinota bacterium]|nr:diguanylate cyclase [Nitrospinota bacterium]MDH5789073.1 diguanylate cyclase [Nitrospinota bacterium]
MKLIENDIRILIAEDDEDDLFLFRELISEWKNWDYYARRNDKAAVIVDSARTREDIFQKLLESHYDLIFLDYRLGEWNGLDLLKEVRQKSYTIPVIILTGQGDQEVAVKAMKAGATDYLVKASLTPESLFKTIRHTINLFREEQQRIQAEESLKAQGLLLHGVSEAAIRLLTVYDHESAIREALGIAGKAGNIDRVYIFQDHPHPETGEGAFSLKYFWCNEGESNFTKFLHDLPYTSLGLNEWVTKLRMGESVSRVVDSLDAASQFFQNQGIKSFVLAPFTIDHTYWGFALFANRHFHRVWSPDEESILKTFSASIGGEIKRNRDDQAFRSIVEGTSAQTGNEFFKSLVRHLASALPARCAMVSEILEEHGSRCRVIAGWNGEQFVSDHQYEVTHTPYEDLLGGQASFYSDGVQEAFPEEIFLREIGAKSYAGVPFFDSSRNVMGHLVVFDRRPMLDKERTISILRVFASRAGAELERQRAEETIKNMAYYDSLTGLPNRVLLIDRLTLALAHAHRVKKRLAVMFLDFDNFKLVNDNYGHSIGDLFLKEMGQRLKSAIREEDTLARLGGDEFIIVLPELVDRENAMTLAEKLVELGRKPFDFAGNKIKSSFSIGIALYPDDGDDYETLLDKADTALYKAKRKGRDGYHFTE